MNCNLVVIFMILSLLSADARLTTTQQEYLRIFKNIPRLFDYLLATLNERPEVLEKNDIKEFAKRSVDYYDYNEDEAKNYESFSNEESYDEDSVIHHASSDPIEDIVSEEIEGNDYETQQDWSNEDAFVFGFEAPGGSLFKVDPEEIEHKALEVEKLLEEHNTSKANK